MEFQCQNSHEKYFQEVCTISSNTSSSLFTPEGIALKDFAITLHYHSNKAYNFARKLLTLPDPSTIRKWTGIIDCYPGFQIPALNYLKGLRKQELELGKNDYENASLVIDAITLKEQIQFDKKSGKLFGFVDLGGGCSGGGCGGCSGGICGVL